MLTPKLINTIVDGVNDTVPDWTAQFEKECATLFFEHTDNRGRNFDFSIYLPSLDSIADVAKAVHEYAFEYDVFRDGHESECVRLLSAFRQRIYLLSYDIERLDKDAPLECDRTVKGYKVYGSVSAMSHLLDFFGFALDTRVLHRASSLFTMDKNGETIYQLSWDTDPLTDTSLARLELVWKVLQEYSCDFPDEPIYFRTYVSGKEA